VPEAWREALRNEIASWLSRHAACCQGFYDMMRYQLTTDNAPPGTEKMFCASLCLLACQAVGGDWRPALRAAVAVELLFHWFRIHQQIERHTLPPGGGAAVWQQWGDAQAINTGDGLFALALVIALQASDDAETALLVSRELCTVSLVFAEEQQLALDWTGQVSAAAYEEAALRQIGALGGFSAWTGAVMAGGEEETRRALRAFGVELGAAWQIADALQASRVTEESEVNAGGGPKPAGITADMVRRHIDRAATALRKTALTAEGRAQLEEFARGLVR
jgi:geranylgeranyl pyrophosphate synthase